MGIRDASDDVCPNCRQRFEIVLVKFNLAGVQMIGACPNCAMINDDGLREIFAWPAPSHSILPYGLMPEAG
jgi:hypothetical protein